MPSIEVRTHIACPPELVFDLLLDLGERVRDIETSGTNGRLVAVTPMSRTLRLGSQVTWHQRHFRKWWSVTSQVTEYDRPLRYVDEQVAGPMKWFRHEHLFIPTDTGVGMIDHVDFRCRYGPIGSVFERAGVTGYVRRLVEGQARHVKRLAEARWRAHLRAPVEAERRIA